MKGLAELVVSLCDLCEAEGRLLEAGILRTVRRAGLLSLGLLFGAAALALLLGALYGLLTALLPTPAALALLGCASAAIAGILFWNARRGGAQAQEEEKTEPVPGGKGARQAAGPHGKPAAAASGHRGGDTAAVWADVPPYGHSAGSRENG